MQTPNNINRTLKLSIFTPLKQRIKHVEKWINKNVSTEDIPNKYIDSFGYEEYESGYSELDIMCDELSHQLLTKCSYSIQLPMFIFLLKHIDRSKLVERTLNNFHEINWDKQGNLISKELSIEIGLSKKQYPIIDTALSGLMKVISDLGMPSSNEDLHYNACY